MRRLVPWFVLTAALSWGCATNDDVDSDSDTDTDTDTDSDTEGPAIPDPGTGAASWISSGDNGTPETAWPVGVASTDPGYIEGDTTETGNAFFVFRAQGDFDMQFWVSGGAASDFVHLHRGDGLRFGAEITPIESTAASGTWHVEDGKVYVFEVHLPGGGFF